MKPQTDSLQLPRWAGPVFMLIGGLCIGYAPIGLKFAVAHSNFEPLGTALWRYLLAIPILLVMFLATERRLPSLPHPLLLGAALCFALDISLWHVGLTYTSVANATFLVNMGSVSVGLLAWFLLRERPNLNWAAAFVIAVTGAALLSFGAQKTGNSGLLGDGLSALAAAFVAFYILFVNAARRSHKALEAIFWVTLFAGLFQLIITLMSDEPLLPQSLDDLFWPFTLAIVAQILGQGFIVWGLGLTSVSVAGVLVLVQPVSASLMSWMIFGETLTVVQLGGAVLISVGICVSQIGRGAVKTGPARFSFLEANPKAATKESETH